MGVTFEDLWEANFIEDTVYKGGKVSEHKRKSEHVPGNFYRYMLHLMR